MNSICSGSSDEKRSAVGGRFGPYEAKEAKEAKGKGSTPAVSREGDGSSGCKGCAEAMDKASPRQEVGSLRGGAWRSSNARTAPGVGARDGNALMKPRHVPTRRACRWR